MAVVVILPKQGQSVESCIVTELRKKKNDLVSQGDVLFAYETDKASFEEVSPESGVVLECFCNEGDEVPVLSDMMVIGHAGEDYSALLSGSVVREAPLDSEKPEESVMVQPMALNEPEKTVEASDRVGVKGIEKFASPRARKLMAEESVDMEQWSGSGPNGRIVEKDVRAVLENRPRLTSLAKKVVATENVRLQEAGSGLAGSMRSVDLLPPVNAVYGPDFEDKKLSNMRKIIAKSMHASLQNSAQLTHHLGADARRMMELRKKAKGAFEAGALGVNITLNDMVCYAVIRALKQFPNVNAHFLGESVRLFKKVHLGLAVDTERGLMVPVVRNADDLSLMGLADQLKGVANACRKGGIAPELLASEAASFTVSNLGNYGVEMFTPVINLPQVAILGVNTVVPRPKDIGDGIYAFVPYLGLSLTYDHRALDGGEATRFLKQIALEIENLDLDMV